MHGNVCVVWVGGLCVRVLDLIGVGSLAGGGGRWETGETRARGRGEEERRKEKEELNEIERKER